jgi:hypothetical protein
MAKALYGHLRRTLEGLVRAAIDCERAESHAATHAEET